MVMVNEMWRQDPIKDEDQTEEFVYFDSKVNVKFSFDPITLKTKVHGDANDYPEQIDPDWTSYK